MNEYVDMFATLFAGRTDAHGSWTGGKLDGYPDYNQHLHDGPYVGVYCVDDNNMCHWGCIDIDGKDHPIDIENCIWDWDTMWTVANNLHDALAYKNITAWTERTTNGIHLWTFPTEPVPATIMRRALLVACDVIDYQPKEVNPKSEYIGVKHEPNCPNGPGVLSGTTGGRRMLHHSPPEEEGKPHGKNEAGNDRPGHSGTGHEHSGDGSSLRSVPGEGRLQASLGMGGGEEGGRDRLAGGAPPVDGEAAAGSHSGMPGCGEACRNTGKKLGNYVRLCYPGAAIKQPADRFVIDEDGPLHWTDFIERAYENRTDPSRYKDVAEYYTPPAHHEVNVDVEATSKFKLLYPALPPVVQMIYEQGPLGDRSSALMKTAVILRDNGWQAQAAYDVLDNMDLRLGKFVGREDREMRLLQMIEDVY